MAGFRLEPVRELTCHNWGFPKDESLMRRLRRKKIRDLKFKPVRTIANYEGRYR